MLNIAFLFGVKQFINDIMKSKLSTNSIIRILGLIMVILIASPLKAQQSESAPSITIISPASADSLNFSGVVLVSAEIVSYSALENYRIILDGETVVNQTGMKPEQKDENTFVIGSFVPLKKGLNSIHVEANNSFGVSISKSIKINCQLEPFVTWLEPGSDNNNFESGRAILKLEIKTGYNLTRLKININGTESANAVGKINPGNDNTWLFEESILLKPGKNSVFISAENTKGITRSTTRIINFGIAPVITLITPAPKDSLNNSGLTTVKAEIVSKEPLTSFRIINNGATVASQAEMIAEKKDEKTYIIASNVPLGKGLNSIIVEAKNSLGTSVSEKRSINSHLEPFISWKIPESDNSNTNSGTVTIKAEIKTVFPLQSINTIINGSLSADELPGLSPSRNDTYVFEKSIKLSYGKNSISISAGNARGTIKSAARIINYGASPVITLLKPSSVDSLNTSGVSLVRSEIVSLTPLQTFCIYLNGLPVISNSEMQPEQKDSITYIILTNVPLQKGTNTLYIEAKNLIGTATSDRRTVISQSEPFITWLSPYSENSLTESGIVHLKAEIKSSLDLQSIKLNLNGTDLESNENELTRFNDDTYYFEKVLQSSLSTKNTLFLTASNVRGTTTSLIRNISYSSGKKPVITIAATDSLNNSGIVLFSADIVSPTKLQAVRIIHNGTIVIGETALNPEQIDDNTYRVKSLVPLKSGLNTFYVEAKNTIGTSRSGKCDIICQPEPIIKWVLPAAINSTAGNVSLNIKAEIITSFDLLNASVNLNGNLLPDQKEAVTRLNNETYIIERTIPLTSGENTLFLIAGNARGTVNSVTRKVNYKPAEIPAVELKVPPSLPELSWNTPFDSESVVSNSSLDIKINIKSAEELRNIVVYHNGKAEENITMQSSIKKENDGFVLEGTLQLTPGENSVYASAGNIAGIATSPTRMVTYNEPREVQVVVQEYNEPPAQIVAAQENIAPPVVTWISPSRQNTSISLNSAQVRANVKSSEELQSLLIYVNGVASEEINKIAPAEIEGEYTVEKTINLLPGENNIYLIATNSLGTTRSEDRFLTNPPANPPVVSWAIPADPNSIVSTDIVVIEACIKSATELKSAQIFVNGVQQASEMMFQAPHQGDCNYRLVKPVLLKQGDNSIRINATNYAGSEWSDVRQIRYLTSFTEKRLALIIGNAEYSNSMVLKNPVNDANLIEGTLKSLDFEVIKTLNATKTEMEQAIRDFSKKLKDYNVALFYYAGHGMQVDGENYLIPTDAAMKEQADCKWEAIRVNYVVEEFEKVPENINIVILDACRNNPFRSWVRGGEQGFRALNAVSGTIVSFATSEGATAADGLGTNGTYTEELVKQMLVPQSISSVFINTRRQVMQRTNNIQRPQEWNMLTGDFYFKK